MGINIGDAILRFLADTGQLDSAIDRVNTEVPAKLKPAQAGVREIGGAFDKAATSAGELASEAATAGAAGAEAGAATAAGMTEAAGAAEAATFGMTTFAIASSAGLLAFGALIPLVAQLPGYIQDVWEGWTGWTKAEQDSYAQLVLINAEMVTFSRSLDTQIAHLSELPLTGSAKLAEYVKNLKGADVKEALANFTDITNKINALDASIHGTHKETWIDELGSSLEVDVPNAADKSAKEIADITEQLSKARQESVKAEEALRRLEQVKIPGADVQRQLAVQQEQEQAAAKTEAAERAAAQAERQRIADTVAAWKRGLQDKRDATDGFHQVSKQDEANYWAEIYLTTQRGSELSQVAWHEMRQAQQGADKEAISAEVADVQQRVAAERAGSQERVTILENELKLMLSLGQGGTREYRQIELEKTRAVREAADSRTRDVQRTNRVDRELAAEQGRFEIATLKERSSANDAYYASLYERGKISFEQMIDLQKQEADALYELEVAALQRRFNATASTEVVERKRILDEVLVLTQQHNDQVIALEREKQAAIDETTIGIKRGMNAEQQWYDWWVKGAPKLSTIWKSLANTGKQMFSDLRSAQEQAVASWILGQDSLGHAMRKATAQVLAEYAARAAIEAIYWTAYGFAMLATMQYDRASQAFTAAAMLGAFAVVAGAAAYGINPRDDKAADNTGSDKPIDNSAGQPEQTITTNRNVLRFGAGALVSTPTVAVIGDAKSSMTAAREGILPLDDPDAMSQIAGALTAAGFGGTHVYVEGLISPDNLDTVIGQISQRVEHHDVPLVSTVSRRVIKRG